MTTPRARPPAPSDDDARDRDTGAPNREHKRALSSLLPPTRRTGDGDVLFRALARAAEEDPDALTHGFHSYPARMHRSIAAHLLDVFAPSGSHVADPFCGSGTVLVEARARGLASTGVDLNPLALRLARLKTAVLQGPRVAALGRSAATIVERSKERVRKKDRARAPIDREEAARFDPHVLAELAVLLQEVRAERDEKHVDALELVFSAILTKVSRARSDTDRRESGKRIGRFIPTEMFGRKAEELCERLRVLAATARTDASVWLEQEDMRAFAWQKRADLVVSSPPYGGTYDYATHHDGRIAWLGLDDTKLRALELGARRDLSQGGTSAWDRQMSELLASLARGLSARGRAVLLVGDGQIGVTRVDAAAQIERLAPAHRLKVAGTASAPRPDRRGGAERFEHLVMLTR